MNDVPKPPIYQHTDGNVSVSEEIAISILSHIKATCQYYGVDDDLAVGQVLAVTAGYGAGGSAEDRERVIKAREKLVECLDKGFSAGMETNPDLPRMNS